MSQVVNMTAAAVTTTQQRLQQVQIARNLTTQLYDAFSANNVYADAQERLKVAINQLRLTEADICDALGFDRAASKLRSESQ